MEDEGGCSSSLMAVEENGGPLKLNGCKNCEIRAPTLIVLFRCTYVGFVLSLSRVLWT